MADTYLFRLPQIYSFSRIKCVIHSTIEHFLRKKRKNQGQALHVLYNHTCAYCIVAEAINDNKAACRFIICIDIHTQ